MAEALCTCQTRLVGFHEPDCPAWVPPGHGVSELLAVFERNRRENPVAVEAAREQVDARRRAGKPPLRIRIHATCSALMHDASEEPESLETSQPRRRCRICQYDWPASETSCPSCGGELASSGAQEADGV